MRLFIIILLTILQNICSKSEAVQVKISTSSSVRINNSIRAQSKTLTVPVFYQQNQNDGFKKKEQYENGSKNIEDQLDPWIRQSILSATKQMANKNKYLKNLGKNMNKKARKIQVYYKNLGIPQTKIRGRIAVPSVPRGVKRLYTKKYSPDVSAASPSSSQASTSRKQQKQSQSYEFNNSGFELNLETDLNFEPDNQINRVEASGQQKNFQ